MALDLPLSRSAGARFFLLGSAWVTAGALLWTLLLWNGHEHDDLTLTRHIDGFATIFFVLFARNDRGGAICGLVILGLAALVPLQSSPRKLLYWIGSHPWPVALLACIGLAFGTVFVYHDHPLAMDEYAVWFQGRVFAGGHLTGKFPLPLLDWLIPPGFQDVFLNVSHATGEVASSYWPSFSLLLAPFAWAGVPWLCNPVITATTLVVIHRIVLELLHDVEAAGCAVLLTLGSPVIFADGISYYSMAAHLLANSLYALLLLRPTPAKAFMAGIVGSVALTLHNPVPHTLFALPWLVWLAFRPDRWKLLGAICAGYLPLCLLLGLGWFLFSQQLIHQATTAAVATPTDIHAGLRHALAIFDLPSASVLLARAIGICKVWIWSVPGLGLIALAGVRQGWSHPVVRLLTASAVLTLVGYLFVPADQGHGWGYRYFHSAWLALPLLGTIALYGQREADSTSLLAESGLKAFIATAATLSLVLGVGFRAIQIEDFVSTWLAQAPAYKPATPAVIVYDDSHTFYGAELVQNDPWLRGSTIRLYSHGPQSGRLATLIDQNFPGASQVYEDGHGSIWLRSSP